MERLTSRIDLRKLSARRTVWYAMHVPGSARHDGIPHAMMCCVDFRGLRRFRHDACRRCIFRVRRRFRHDATVVVLSYECEFVFLYNRHAATSTTHFVLHTSCGPGPDHFHEPMRLARVTGKMIVPLLFDALTARGDTSYALVCWRSEILLDTTSHDARTLDEI